jgi:thiamine-phosphate pyrophosphorylase
MEVPLVAIGGITPKNGPLLIAAGARMLAIISGVFAQPDVTAAARTYASLFPAGDPR